MLAAQAQALPTREEAPKRGDLQRTAVVAAPPAPTQPTVASTESKKVNDSPIIMNGQVGCPLHGHKTTIMVPTLVLTASLLLDTRYCSHSSRC